MKRMLKQLACMTAAVLLAVSSFPAATMASEGFTGEYERLIDMADLLTYEEESELLETLNEISERQKMDIVVITSEDMDGYTDIQEYADDLYDYCDYGMEQTGMDCCCLSAWKSVTGIFPPVVMELQPLQMRESVILAVR